MSSILKIQIDHEKPVYSSGDAITGRVVLHSPKDEAVGSVSISFQGRAKTKIHKRNGNNRSSTYRGRGTFFSYHSELYTGIYTMRSDVYQWPFQFQFPETTEITARGNQDDFFDARYPYKATGVRHPLPPTFSTAGNGFNSTFQCFTEYKLEAILTRPAETYRFYKAPVERFVELTYFPRRAIQHPDPIIKSHDQFCRAQTLRLDPSKADEKLTFKEKMHSTFKKSQLPYSSFKIRFDMPTKVYPGGSFPLKVYLQHVYSSAEVPVRPAVLLNSVNVEVKTSTCVRCAGIFGDHNGDDSQRRSVLSRSGLSIPIPYSEANAKAAEAQPNAAQPCLDITSMFPAKTMALCPDFSTYNIAISHELGIKIEVSCADKDFAITSKSYLEVLPPVFGIAGIVQPAPSPAAETSAEPLPPPAYEHAPGYMEENVPPVLEI